MNGGKNKLTCLYAHYKMLCEGRSHLGAVFVFLMFVVRRIAEKAIVLPTRARLAMEIRDPDDLRPRLAVRISGGIGDYIVTAQYLRDLAMSRCPRGFESPICMTQDPVVVAKTLLGQL